MGKERQRWLVGIDWGSQEHVVVLCDSEGKRIGRRRVEHGGPGLTEMMDWLLKMSGAEPGDIHVAIETPHGPIVEALLERGFQVYAINPKQLDRFRDRFSPAGAKDDDRDADVLADSLRTDARAFRKLSVAEPTIVEMREWLRIAEELKVERGRCTSRLRDQLWRYYPQLLDLADDLGTDWLLELWEMAPTPDKAARVREATIERLLKRHRIRRFDAAHALSTLRTSALAVAKGTVEAASAHIRVLIARLRLLNRQLAEAERQLDRLCESLTEPAAGGDGEAAESDPGQLKEQHDATILDSLPGVGRIVLATLLTEAPDALQRRDYQALRCLSGAAPVTRRSGKTRLVLRRYACNGRLCNAIFYWAGNAIKKDPLSRAKYDAFRARGHSHARALRQVGDRLLNVACAMLRTGTLFNPAVASEKCA